jgi:hypothetical protein
MTATDHIRAAARILDRNRGFDSIPEGPREGANAHARIALAMALSDLAAAAKADVKPDTRDAAPQREAWPVGVTARILTRVGMRHRGPQDAAVDIIDDQSVGTNGVTTAVCRPCGWTRDNGTASRDKVLELARAHADDCTALPQPTS